MSVATSLLASVVIVGLAAFLNGNNLVEISYPTQAWRELARVTERAGKFCGAFDLNHSLPTGNETWRDYRRVEVALMRWHVEFYTLQSDVKPGRVDTEHMKLLGNTLRREADRNQMSYDEDEQGLLKGYGSLDSESGYHSHKQFKHYRDSKRKKLKQTRPQSPIIEPKIPEQMQSYEPLMLARMSPAVLSTISHVLAVYGLLLLFALALRDTKLYVVVLVTMIVLLPIVWQAKQLRSALHDAVDTLRLRQVQLAGVFPSTSKAEMIAQHLILEKIEIICNFWEKQTLGLGFSLKVPLIGMRISIDTDLLVTMVVANGVKLGKVVFKRWIFPSRRPRDADELDDD